MPEVVDDAAGQRGGGRDAGRSRLGRALVLGGSVIGLQPAEPQVRARGDLPGERHGLRPRRDPASAGPDVDLDQDREAHAGLPGRGFDRLDAAPVVGADRDRADPRERREAGELARAHDLVADQDVGHAAPGQDLGLGDLLHALSHGAARHLQVRHDGGFMGLGMGSKLHAGRGRHGGHRVEVERESIEVDDEGRRVDRLDRHPGFGGRVLQHRIRPRA